MTEDRTLGAATLSCCTSGGHATDAIELGRTLGAAIDDARARWPGIDLDPIAFARHVGERIDPERAPAASLAEMDLVDLWLACACCSGVTAAIAAFERQFAPELERAFARLKTRANDADDLRQRLLTRLFIGDGRQPPRIHGYSGFGRLRAWVRVAATRLRIDAERVLSERQDVEPPDPHGGAPLPVDDPELAYLRHHYRAEFVAALGDAFGKLLPRQRMLLRQHLVHGVGSADIAALFGVHRATAKRWLADARECLLSGTRRELAERVGRGLDELDSILQLIESRLEVSLRLVLHETQA